MFTNRRWPTLALVAALVVSTGTATYANLDEAMNHFRAGEYAEAAGQFQVLVDQSPSYDYGWFMLGMSFLQMKKVADAEKNLMKAIELNGDKFQYHHALAKVYYDQKQYQKAVGTITTAEPLASDKTQWNLYYLRGVSNSALERWSDAIDDLEQAKAIKTNTVILDRLGAAYYEMGYYDKALPSLQAALQKSPDSPALLLRTTNAQLNLGAESKDEASKANHYREALVFAEKYNSLKPNSVDGNNLVGRAALGAKEYPQAEVAFKKVLSLKSDHCYAMANLGKTYIAEQKWADAEQTLVGATQCAPRMAVAYEGLGFAQQKQKKLEPAIASYEKALAISPSATTQKAIEICQENISRDEHNKEMDQLDADQNAAEKEEAERLATEEAKRKEWVERRKRDE